MQKHWLVGFIMLFFVLGFTGDTPFNYLPKPGINLLISHQYYSASYVTEFKQSEWVAYRITTETAFGNTKRSNSFKEDEKANDIDLKPFYVSSGYDRGHLCPAGSMAFNTTAMTESFFMTNMSPQDPGFNRGIWKKLESQVRTWGYENRQIFVVTGPILTEFQDTIGQIPVPKYFYKVILDYQLPELKAIGLILENRPSHQPLIEFVVSVDSVEKMTNLDFFYELPDSLEHELESNSNADLWSWKTVKVLSTKSSKIESEFQCIALTNKNIQCTRTVSDSNSFCWQHEPENKDTMVWICGKSKIYHLANNHGSLKRCKSGVHKMTLREAENKGFRKCKE